MAGRSAGRRRAGPFFANRLKNGESQTAMKRIGVVGLGLNNPYFYAPLLKELGASVCFVWDYTEENARAYAGRFGCEVVRDIAAYPDVDGVLIDSRNCDHIPLALPFIKRGAFPPF